MKDQPEFNPHVGYTLREMIDILERRAAMIEQSARAGAAIMGGPPDAGIMRDAHALDKAREIFEAMVPNWPQHKALIARAMGRRDK